jgi:glucokinase
MSDTQSLLERIPFPALIGDIGGTNARFALIPDPGATAIRFADERTAEFATIDDAIGHALEGLPIQPRSATLALAAPIDGDKVPLTNCDWVVEPARLIRRFGLADTILLNDFEAQSLALPDLGPGDIEPIGGGAAEPNATRLVVGPGTGLGAGALVHAQGIWIPVPGEGGHIDLGPVSARDMALWPHLERLHGRISAEALLCGPGMVRLYRGVAALNGRAAPFATPAEVANAGLARTDADAAETLDLFATYLGRFAGDLALVFMARGGVFLSGGISGRIAMALKSGSFREAFLAKAPHRGLLEGMATAIITKTDAALAGIAAFVRSPARFGVELTGRRWRG